MHDPNVNMFIGYHNSSISVCLEGREMLKYNIWKISHYILCIGLLVQLLRSISRFIFCSAGNVSWELQHKRSTTKDRLSLCFLSHITDIWKTPFQTYIYHVDRFGHICTAIFSFLLSPVLPSTFNPQIITLCGPFLMPSACMFSKIDTAPVTTVIIMSFEMVALVEVSKITAFQQTNFMNVFPSCRLPASEASCTIVARERSNSANEG